ncbi:MAG: type II secretion system protein, partial [Bacilli bacterium]|nr:type II secretion system protein [Bacilli bacterium]
MKRRKGFTLIELLAVIVIIGAVALIVTPVIISVIKQQEKNTFEESIHGILKAIEIDMADDNFNFP